MGSNKGGEVGRQEPSADSCIAADSCSHKEDEECVEVISPQLNPSESGDSSTEVQSLKKLVNTLSGEVKGLQEDNLQLRNLINAQRGS